MTSTQPIDKSRWLHVPMEIVDRELYPKLLLISEAINDGWQCVIGTKRALIDAADKIPPGVIYLKSVIPSEYVFMKRFKENGHRLVSLDEEGLIQTSLDTLVSARYCDKTVALTEKFFCWGSIQRKALQERYPEHASKFKETGSPTADLWNLKAHDVHQQQVDKLHERYGKYILFPSSFAVPNHFMGPEEALGIMKRDNMFRNEEEYKYYKRYHDYVEKVFHAFLKLLPDLAKEFPNHTIIVRPHPSDNHETWKNAVQAEGINNAEVIFQGSVSPWLLGAEAILHWGSTTGLEAYLLGRPVIGHTPYPEEEKAFDVLPHLVSIMTHSKDEVFNALRYVINNPDDWKSHYPDVLKGHKKLREWIYNMDGKPATRTIMDDLATMNVEEHSFNGTIKKVVKSQDFKEIVWKGFALLDKLPLLAKFFPERIKLGLKSREFGHHKTKPVREEEIKLALKQISNVPTITQKLSDDLFLIRKA